MTVSLQKVYASEIGVSRSLRQIGLVYSGGLWVSVTPKAYLSENSVAGSELSTVSEAFAADDFPGDMSTDTVRGHVAWATQLLPSALCPAGSNSTASEEASMVSVGDGGLFGSGPPFSWDAVAELVWLENDVVLHVGGPFNVATLKSIVQTITWL